MVRDRKEFVPQGGHSEGEGGQLGEGRQLLLRPEMGDQRRNDRENTN